jgi:chemotaxis protein methyltransferase CheR
VDQSKILDFFAHYIEKKLGIIYAEHNYFQLVNRLEDVAKKLNIENIESLYTQAQKGIVNDFERYLLDVSTNNETSFFRDEKVFLAIDELVQAKLGQGSSPPVLRFWSAACSTGQEALSLSMTLLERQEKDARTFTHSILATDISSRALSKAESGLYSKLEVERGLPPFLKQKYFSSMNNEQWLAREHLRQSIKFKMQNLRDPFDFDHKFDFILCRNVLIYQNVESKVEIVSRLSDCLVSGGYLILGSGESLIGLSKDFDQCHHHGAVVYQKKCLS